MITQTKKQQPPYKALEEELRAKVAGGYWSQGSVIPGRRLLAKQFGVDQNTINRAIAPLVSEGILQTGGHGTVVAKGGHEVAATPVQNGISAVRFAAGTIGIVASFDDTSSWTLRIVQKLESAYAVAGGRTMCFNRMRPGKESASIREAVEALIANGVSSLAFVGVYDIPEFAESIVECVDIDRIPYVIVGWDDIKFPVPHVFYDNQYAGYQAATHLVKHGCRQIGFLAPVGIKWVEDRLEGAARAMKQFALATEPLVTFATDRLITQLTTNDAQMAMNEACQEVVDLKILDFIRNGQRQTGVIAANDYLALQIIEAGRREGLEIGEDYLLLGFDDHLDARTAGLSSFRPPLDEMAQAAANLLLQWVGGDKTSMQLRLCSTLVPRMSTHFKA